FGARTLTGIALTAFGGRAAYFDHIYLGRTVEDLDRVDATGLRDGKPVELAAADLERLWRELAGGGAERAYRALWTLVAAAGPSVPFLRRKLAAPEAAVDEQRLSRWVRELDHDRFTVREAAARGLEQNLEAAVGLLEQARARGPSAEAARRIDRLLRARRAGGEEARVDKAVRALEYAGGTE